MAEWIGYSVSVNCAEPSGCYQGVISDADGSKMKLTKVFRNGFPYPKDTITLKASDIRDLKIIDTNAGSQQNTEVIKPAPKRVSRSTVSDNLQTIAPSFGGQSSPSALHKNGQFYMNQNGAANANGGNKQATKNAANFPGNPRSNPIDIQNRQNRASFTTSGPSYHYGSTPNKKDKMRKKNEICFGTPSDDPMLNQEFDFEKNLALFDKQALWDELKQSHKPDVVRQTDQSRRPEQHYRHDENVLTVPPTIYSAIVIPESCRGEKIYVTDEGLVVPSVTLELRTRILGAAGRAGLAAGGELAARAAADAALRLLGGSWRLDPRNAHQPPRVAVLAGPHRQGAVGVMCARHLASHGVKTEVSVSAADLLGSLRSHLDLYKMTGHRIVTELRDLSAADLVVLAASEEGREPPPRPALAAWLARGRAPVLALDPPACGTPGVQAKYSLVSVLPLSYAPSNGQLYLCNLSVPEQIFTDLGVQYRSPFGAKSAVALHPADS